MTPQLEVEHMTQLTKILKFSLPFRSSIDSLLTLTTNEWNKILCCTIPGFYTIFCWNIHVTNCLYAMSRVVNEVIFPWKYRSGWKNPLLTDLFSGISERTRNFCFHFCEAKKEEKLKVDTNDDAFINQTQFASSKVKSIKTLIIQLWAEPLNWW